MAQLDARLDGIEEALFGDGNGRTGIVNPVETLVQITRVGRSTFRLFIWIGGFVAAVITAEYQLKIDLWYIPLTVVSFPSGSLRVALGLPGWTGGNAQVDHYCNGLVLERRVGVCSGIPQSAGLDRRCHMGGVEHIRPSVTQLHSLYSGPSGRVLR